MPRAQIVVHPPPGQPGAFRFDLIDLDGPRCGRRLADFEVPAQYEWSSDRATPDPLFAADVRARLVAYGTRNGYAVVDDRVVDPATDAGHRLKVLATRPRVGVSRRERRHRD
jgi:hypothetical protein